MKVIEPYLGRSEWYAISNLHLKDVTEHSEVSLSHSTVRTYRKDKLGKDLTVKNYFVIILIKHKEYSQPERDYLIEDRVELENKC